MQKWKSFIVEQLIFITQCNYIQSVLPITVPYVILKGTSVAQYYPYPDYRMMGDIDIMTRREDLETACEQLMEAGYASVGANATIVCGNTIGEWAMIAAGAVVTSDVPNHALMMGVPARIRGWVCECGDVLSDDLVCDRCGRTYVESSDGLQEVK